MDDVNGTEDLTLEQAFRTYATDQKEARLHYALFLQHRYEVQDRKAGRAVIGTPMTYDDLLLLVDTESTIREEIRTSLLCGEILARGFIAGSLSVSSIPPLWWKQATFNIAENSAEANGSKVVGLAFSRAAMPPNLQTLEPDQATPNTGPVYSTGMAGKPTSKQLILGELRARHTRGETLPQVSAEALHLSVWLSDTHPDAPSSGLSATENTIRNEYKGFKKALK